MAFNDFASMDMNGILFIGVLLLFALLLMLELFRPFRRFGVQIAKASFVTNTSAFLFNNVVLSLLSVSSLFAVAERYSQVGLLAAMDGGIAKGILSFVLFDLVIYLWHAASHRFEPLWRFHKIHHSDKSLNVTTGFRFHVIDLFLELILKCIVVVILGLEAYTVLICELVRMLFVLFHHTNVSFAGERWLSSILITPSLHRLHHSTVRSEHDSNYGIVMSVWDQLFRTRQEGVPEKIGLELIEAENFVQLFCLAFITERRIAQLLHMIPRGHR